MYSAFNNLKIEIYGQSHSNCVGAKVRGIPLGAAFSTDEVQRFVLRRASGNDAWSTPRKEPDEVIFVSGITNGVVTADEVECKILNVSVKKNDYQEIKYIPRPSHADYVSAVKDKTGCCPSGGGRFSGRLTAPLCAIGGIAKQILSARGIKVLSYISQIGCVAGDSYRSVEITEELISGIQTPLKSLTRADEMVEVIKNASQSGDSVGGRVDVVVLGMPVGVGDNLFSGLESRLACAVYGVPAVKGVEFGHGFDFASANGSKVNDAFVVANGKVATKTNYSGGINGGISNGMPITMSVAFRPTPSIATEQESFDLRTGKPCAISVKGRHDACIVPRGAVCLEAVVSLAILDAVLDFDKGE